MSTPLHWYEGLFLEAHHLQTFQRSMLHQAWAGPRMHSPFHYGVVESKLSADELADGRIRFSKLHLILRSGTVFRFPEDAVLATLDVEEALRARPAGFRVGLALPDWRAEAANTNAYQAANDEGCRYCAHELEVWDENTGKNEQKLQVVKLNGQLVIEEKLRRGMEFFPLVRVIPRATEDGVSHRIADPKYVPATLLLSGSPTLFNLVRDLAVATNAVRSQIAEQLASSPFDLRVLQGAQFEQVSRLRCLSRGASLLVSLVDDDSGRTGFGGRVPTGEVYLAMQDLLAELSAIYPAKGVFSWLPYNHDDPYPAFADLDAKIRGFLFPRGKNFRKFDFALDRGHFFGEVPPGFFDSFTGCYLSIETDQNPTNLARLVENPDHFKLLPASYVEEMAVRGLSLQEERNVPADLPLRAGQYYYRVNPAKSAAHIWQDFQREPKAAVHFQDANLTRYRLALYVTTPSGA